MLMELFANNQNNHPLMTKDDNDIQMKDSEKKTSENDQLFKYMITAFDNGDNN